MVLRSEREGGLKRKVGVNVIALVGLDLRNDVAEIPGGFLVSIEMGPGLLVNRFHMLTTYIAFLR